jgi:hypothetical protein
MKYLVKNASEQDSSITIIKKMENKMAIAEVTDLTSLHRYDFSVAIPEQIYANLFLYDFTSGKRFKTDIFMGKVKMTPTGEPGRMVSAYSDQQLADRLALHKWFALEVFIADMYRMGKMEKTVKDRLTQEVQDINNDDAIRAYIIANLYYDI